MQAIWIGFACEEESRIILVTGFFKDISRAEALKLAKKRTKKGYEVTVINFLQSFEIIQSELVNFLLDCGVPPADVMKIVPQIGTKIGKLLSKTGS